MTLQGVKRKVVSVGDFRFTGRLLGKGNFARVEEAVHNILNVKVAVKIIDIKDIKEKYVVKNLHREARILSTLNHPCIASLFQTIQMDDNVYYLITELVSGGDLCSFIIGQRYGKLEERSARTFARQFASALAHMHSFGIVHRGIIFYGMMVGQLPFVGGRKNQLSSQERRKKLVTQINRGLGSTQRQALAPLSPEFRMLLHKLLTADPTKRITIKELLIHPWLTEKGKKCIQKHPLKDLDNVVQTKIIKQVGEIFHTDEWTVNSELLKHPYGRLAGVYNILKFKHISDQFHLEQISPNILRNKRIKSAVATAPKPKSASVVKSQHTLYNQCIVLLNKVSKQEIENRAKSANPALLLSKNVTKLSRTRIDHLQTTKNQTNQTYSKTNSVVANRKIQNSTQLAVRKLPSRIQITDNSPTSNVRRPCTTGTTQYARSVRKSCASAGTAMTERVNNRDFQRRQVCVNPAGMGDCPKSRPSSTVLRKLKSKDPLANEPIARSIAGYLIKNVPEYMFTRMRK
ncbi:maternal embryonic leucine zipper kinase-like isoform X4 [Zophobas morio]|uniref:maternal embryonic leucine zipper kinase-like isoform X4 n=1 Tax=Zophobas morio TaxID=2755281 RepID=UPI003082C4A8